MERLLRLGRLLQEAGYQFTTITPESHARVNRRPGNECARTLRDVFGWSRPFESSLLPQAMLQLLDVERVDDGLLKSKVRFSTDEDKIFVHSAFPTSGADSVFFGPDRNVCELATSMRSGDEILLAVFDPSHWTPQESG